MTCRLCVSVVARRLSLPGVLPRRLATVLTRSRAITHFQFSLILFISSEVC